ncbi:histidine kinase [Streptomyces tricolor]|nr:histidine kinase [Streptomyces tricolor]
MARLLRPLLRGTTYTRLLHLWVPMLAVSVLALHRPVDPVGARAAARPARAGARGAARRGGAGAAAAHAGRAGAGHLRAPAAARRDRLRTVLWLELRMLLGAAAVCASVWRCPVSASNWRVWRGVRHRPGSRCWTGCRRTPAWALLAPLPLLALYAVVVGLGELVTAAARRLLGPSAAERLAALEERTEQLLERTRIARELHDSIGHAPDGGGGAGGCRARGRRSGVHRPGAGRHRGDRPGRAGGPGAGAGRAAGGRAAARRAAHAGRGRPAAGVGAGLRRQGRRRGDGAGRGRAGPGVPRGPPHPPGGAHQCAAARGARPRPGPGRGHRWDAHAGGPQSAARSDTRPRAVQRHCGAYGSGPRCSAAPPRTGPDEGDWQVRAELPLG